MHFMDVVKNEKIKRGEIVPIEIPETEQAKTAASDAPFSIPDGMPLTNHLDKMTPEQAKWAIRNGTAWIAHLKEQRSSGVDVQLVEYEANPVDVSDAEKYKTICDVLESVWLELTENMHETLKPEQIPDWVDTLQWAIKVIPVGYERQRDILQAELREYQPKTRRAS